MPQFLKFDYESYAAQLNDRIKTIELMLVQIQLIPDYFPLALYNALNAEHDGIKKAQAWLGVHIWLYVDDGVKKNKEEVKNAKE